MKKWWFKQPKMVISPRKIAIEAADAVGCSLQASLENLGMLLQGIPSTGCQISNPAMNEITPVSGCWNMVI